MNKTIKIYFLLGLLFFVHSQITATPNLRGEIGLKPISPLVVLQDKDTTYLLEYQRIKQLYEKEDFTTALKLALQLDTRLEKKNSIEVKYANTFLIGKIFRKRNIHANALMYYKKALDFLEKEERLKDGELFFLDKLFEREKKIANTLLSIGSEYYSLNKKDSAAIYYKKSIEISSLNKFPEIKALAYINLSGLYLAKEDFALAKEYALNAVDIYRISNNKLLESSALNNYGSVFLVEKKYEEARKIYTQAIDLIKFDESIGAIKNKVELYYNLAYILYKQKDYKSYEFLDQSYVFKDTLDGREMNRIVQGVYAEYQEQYRVENLKQRVALKKAEEKKTAWFFGVLSLLIIIISGVIIYNYKLRQKNLKLRLDQTQLAQKSKLDKLKSDSQVRILNATLDGKEAERKQIAETLHDSVSSLLSSANLHLQASKMQFKEKAPLEIDKTQKIIIEASQKIRDLSHTLVSSVLLKFGLKYAIKDMAEKYSNSKIEIKTNIKNVRRYQQNFEIKVNNIIQELVNNILKHSKATKATVQMEDKNGILLVDIQDDGDGFDKKEIAKKDGLGINQIEARIQMMKGKLQIDSNAEIGTKIKIELPILEKKVTNHA